MASIFNRFLPASFHFDILQIEAVRNSKEEWAYCNTTPVGTMELPPDASIPTEFVRKLHELSAIQPEADVSTDEDSFEAKQHALYVLDDADFLELCDGKTDEPLYVAIMK